MYLSMANRLLSKNYSHKLGKALSESSPLPLISVPARLYSSPPGWRRKNTYLDQILYSAGRGESGSCWPDSLGILWGKDPRFSLPGNVGFAPEPLPNHGKFKGSVEILMNEPVFWKNVVDSPTNYQTQLAALKQHTELKKVEEAATAAAEYAADQIHFENMECLPVQCPELLRKELRNMFPNVNLNVGSLTVITFAHKTLNDMSSWSPDVEDERERLVEYFIETAKKLCGELRVRAQWADFIDPNSGRPFYGPYTPHTFFETDERYRQLGFRINDLGCCRVIAHTKWGTHAFIGSIFTTAPHDCEYLEGILSNYNPTKDNTSKTHNQKADGNGTEENK